MEEILSKSTIGLRKVGISTLAVAMSLGVAGVTAGAANAAAGDLSADGTPSVTQGVPNQSAADVHYQFDGSYPTNSTITFTVADSDGNSCTTAGDQGVEFTAAPTVTVNAPTGKTAPTATATLGSSSTACATVGIQDQVTITLNGGQPSNDTATTYTLNLSNVTYNVGTKATPGAVEVTVGGTGSDSAASTSVSDATIVNRSFMFVPKMSAQPTTTGNPLGTATYSEASPGAYFAAGDNTVTLTLPTGTTFTAGVTPDITVPSGYSVSAAPVSSTAPATGAPKTDGTNVYTFHVNAPATLPSTGATMTISGLEANSSATVGTVTLTSDVIQGTSTSPIEDTADVLNVVNQARTGGDDRYATAAALFNSEFGTGNPGGPVSSVVLSGGELFPDALSANYLAGELGTGTLLTAQKSLSQEARQAIISHNITTVYITGGTAAVSDAVANELTQTHVSDNPGNSFIQVVRLGGADRYATNAKINRYSLVSRQTAVLAAGIAPYDSLAVGPVVFKKHYPLVLTNGANLKNGEVTELNDFGAQNVVIVGGTAVVSQAVQDELVKDGFNVIRLAGPTRYDSAAAIATWATAGNDANGDGTVNAADGAVNQAQGFNSNTTDITNGLGFADALSAGPVAGTNGEPVLLAKNATEVGDGLAGYLGSKSVGTATDGTEIGTLRALGLTAATANTMMKDAAADIG